MRTSPVHYIAPSAISITPNANQSPRDLAVHVARGAKIKVCYQPIADLGYNDANYKEWTLRGRNRRLAQSGVPYTIYARLNKTDQTDGYLVFAQKVHDEETDEWSDPYILSPNTSATSAVRLEGADGGKYLWGAIPEKQTVNGRSSYWWIRLGSVSAPNDEGLCSVDLDTGILGTDQYNMDWYLDPDKMPQRPVRVIYVERGDWTGEPTVIYTGDTGAMAPDGTLDTDIADALGWTGFDVLSFTSGQEISEPYHCRRLTRNRWLTHRLAEYNAGYTDAELYEKLTTPSRGWEEENWLEVSRVWHEGRLWECQVEGTTDEPGDDGDGWRLMLQSGRDGSGVEFIYYLGTTDHATGQTPAPSTPASAGNGKVDGKVTPYSPDIDDWVPDGWTDNPQGIDYDHQIEWVSQRTSHPVSTGTVETAHEWSGFSTPQVWSKWGLNGMDGDGVEYVFVRTTTNVAPTVDSNSTDSAGHSYTDDEYLPKATGGSLGTAGVQCTDDPMGTDANHPFEWVAKRTKAAPNAETGVRQWEKYAGTMALWSNFAKSITKSSETYRYATNNTGTRPAASSSDWKTTKPALQKGYWLYTETTITWSDNSTTVLYTDERNPNDGVSGQDIIVDGATVIKYYVGDSNTTHPAEDSSDWKDISQVVQTQGKWLWSKATTYYRKASSAAGSHDAGSSSNYNVSYIAKDGAKGDAGTSITVSGDVQEYAVGTSGTTAPTSGWNTAMPAAQQGKFLWTRDTTTYSDGHKTVTYGVSYWGTDGTTLDKSKSYVRYSSVKTAAQPADSTFTLTTPPSLAHGDYLWIMNLQTYTDGTVLKSYSTSYVGTDGTNGDNGADGYTTHFAYATSSDGSQGFSTTSFAGATYIGTYRDQKAADSTDYRKYTWTQWKGDEGPAGRAITSVTEYYKATNSNAAMAVPTSDSGWSTDPNLSDLTQKWGETYRYLWNYEKVTYSSGTTVERTKPQMLAIWTKDGATGKGVDSITNYYKVTASATAPARTSSGWDDNPIAPTADNPYLWNYEKIVWINPSATTYTDVQLIGHYGKNGADGKDGKDGTDGYGVALVLFRNIYSEEQWNAWAVVGQSDDYSKREELADDDFLKCRVGDFFMTTGTATNSGKHHTAVWKCTAVTAEHIWGICVSHVADGDNGGGTPGHVGRWYYYAGEWASGHTYTMQNTQAPFVKYGDSFYMLDNGGKEPSSLPYAIATSTPPSSDSRWTLMQSTMQYYIAQAFFGPYAHFGSFIINGDWMISQHGTVNGAASTNYTAFDPKHPNENTGSNFIPNFAVDGNTGKTYQNAAHVEGYINATSGYIGSLYIDSGQSVLKGSLRLRNDGANDQALRTWGGADIWGLLSLGQSSQGLVSDAYYNQNGKEKALAETTAVWVAESDITLPAWCPLGTMVFVVPINNITVRLANSNERILAGSGEAVTSSEIGKAHAIYIKVGPINKGDGYRNYWVEWFSA